MEGNKIHKHLEIKESILTKDLTDLIEVETTLHIKIEALNNRFKVMMINLFSEVGKIIFSRNKIENRKTSIKIAAETKKMDTIKEDNKISITINQFSIIPIITKSKAIQEMTSDKATTTEISNQVINK